MSGTYTLPLEPMNWYGMMYIQEHIFSSLNYFSILSPATHDASGIIARITGSPPGLSKVKLMAGRLTRVDLGRTIG